MVLDAGPVQALAHLVEGLREEGFLLRADRVVEDEEQASVVPLHVGVVEDEGAGVPDVEGPARVGREAADHPAVLRGRERREFLGARFALRLLEEFGGQRRQLGLLGFRVQAVDLGDDPFDLSGHLLCTGTQGRVLGQELAQDGFGLGLPSMEDGVLQGILAGGSERHGRPNGRRV